MPGYWAIAGTLPLMLLHVWILVQAKRKTHWKLAQLNGTGFRFSDRGNLVTSWYSVETSTF